MQTLSISKINGEIHQGNAYHMHNITLVFPVADIERVLAYTGILAPSMTAYIEPIFKDGTQRCFLIDGHAAAQRCIADAESMGLYVKRDGI